MASKRYPDPHKQVDAGYFWLTIGLIISLFIVIFRPFEIYQFTTGLVLYGLFHLIAGKRAVRELAQNIPEADEWWMSDPGNEEDSGVDFENEIIGDQDYFFQDDYFDDSAAIESDVWYESENDRGDEDMFAKSWRDPVYDQDENDDVEDPPDLIVYSADYFEWPDSDEEKN
jgi:hypothetical protein